jgi:hypothetical protein
MCGKCRKWLISTRSFRQGTQQQPVSSLPPILNLSPLITSSDREKEGGCSHAIASAEKKEHVPFSSPIDNELEYTMSVRHAETDAVPAFLPVYRENCGSHMWVQHREFELQVFERCSRGCWPIVHPFAAHRIPSN